MARLPTFDPSRILDATTLTGVYQDMGTIMGSAVIAFVIYNTSDVDVQISFDDGVTDGPIIPSQDDFKMSRLDQMRNLEDASFMVAKGAQIQVKQVTAAGASGSVIINIARI